MRPFAILVTALTFIGCTTKIDIQGEPDSAPQNDAAPADAKLDGPGPDGSVKASPGWESGSRLRARIYVGSDGSKQFVGWFDKTRGENCSINFGADNTLRCMPTSGNGLAVANIIDNTYYVDASCTQPYAIAPKGCTPKYAMKTEATNACAANFRLHVFQPGTLGNGPTIYQKQGMNCVGSAYNSNLPDLYIPGNEIPASTFADAAEMVE